MPIVEFEGDIKLVSEANQSEHWRVKHKRKKEQQALMLSIWPKGLKVEMPCVVTLTRVGPRKLDKDNLSGSFKHVQDEIARKLSVDDGDESKVMWQYRQEPIGKLMYKLKVRIVSGSDVAQLFKEVA